MIAVNQRHGRALRYAIRFSKLCVCPPVSSFDVSHLDDVFVGDFAQWMFFTCVSASMPDFVPFIF